MGAPEGHPFFGNQYTDGGYEIGSYSYTDNLDNLGVVNNEPGGPVREMLDLGSELLISRTMNLKGESRLPAGKTVVIAGTVIGVVGGAYLLLRKRSSKKDEQNLESNGRASIGVCELCGVALAESRHVGLQEDDEGKFIVCGGCSHHNYAKYTGVNE